MNGMKKSDAVSQSQATAFFDNGLTFGLLSQSRAGSDSSFRGLRIAEKSRPLPQSYSAMDYASLINNVAAMPPSGSADEPHGKAVRCMLHQSFRCSVSSVTERTLLLTYLRYIEKEGSRSLTFFDKLVRIQATEPP